MSEKPSVSSHLKIPLEEYDSRIRTFIPYYEEMLEALGMLVESSATRRPTILDLGIGTGALAERCLQARPEAKLIGIDADPEMLPMALERLQGACDPDLRCGDFVDLALPGSDLIVASFSLHHIPEPAAKKEMFARCREALGDSGALLMADCFPSSDQGRAAEGRAAWRRHMERSYTAAETTGYLEAWAEEDTHFTLDDELEWLEEAGFLNTVVWRKDSFAVLQCRTDPHP